MAVKQGKRGRTVDIHEPGQRILGSRERWRRCYAGAKTQRMVKELDVRFRNRELKENKNVWFIIRDRSVKYFLEPSYNHPPPDPSPCKIAAS